MFKLRAYFRNGRVVTINCDSMDAVMAQRNYYMFFKDIHRYEILDIDNVVLSGWQQH